MLGGAWDPRGGWDPQGFAGDLQPPGVQGERDRPPGLPEGYRGPRGCRTPGLLGGEGTWDPRGDTAGAEGASIDTHPPLGAHSVFLVRESQRNPKGFVLSLCHLQRVKHYLILPVSAGGGGPEGAGGCQGVLGLRGADPCPRSPSRQSEEEGRLYFTMDDGQTRFADLIQLVEFHQINRGILPCKLRHYCTCVAL